MAQVLAAGYPGPLSLEVFNDVFRQADPARAAVDAKRSLLWLQEELDGSLPAPKMTGHAFTELRVDERAEPTVAAALHALGFAHTGQHRTKPVRLWQQGEARVLLNAVSGQGGVAEVAALAVESSDPEASARRAEPLLAPPT